MADFAQRPANATLAWFDWVTRRTTSGLFPPFYSRSLEQATPRSGISNIIIQASRDIQTFACMSWLSSFTNSRVHQNKRGFDNWILIMGNWVLCDVFALLFKQRKPRVQPSTWGRHLWEPATEQLIIYSKTKQKHTLLVKGVCACVCVRVWRERKMLKPRCLLSVTDLTSPRQTHLIHKHNIQMPSNNAQIHTHAHHKRDPMGSSGQFTSFLWTINWTDLKNTLLD